MVLSHKRMLLNIAWYSAPVDDYLQAPITPSESFWKGMMSAYFREDMKGGNSSLFDGRFTQWVLEETGLIGE